MKHGGRCASLACRCTLYRPLYTLLQPGSRHIIIRWAASSELVLGVVMLVVILKLRFEVSAGPSFPRGYILSLRVRVRVLRVRVRVLGLLLGSLTLFFFSGLLCVPTVSHSGARVQACLTP